MMHQQHQHLVDVHPEMKSQLKSLILMTNAQPVNHVDHVMIVETVETVRLVANSHLTIHQNQLYMSVPMASH
jgi:hypothetical protein